MDAQQTRNKALQYLGQRDYSRKDLHKKLLAAPGDPEIIDQVLIDLSQSGYLDDARFAEALVSKRLRQGYGPHWIRQELQQSGVDREIVSAVLESDLRDWQHVAQQLYRKKYGNKPVLDAKEKARRARFMYSKGFAQEQLRGCLQGAESIDEG